METFEYELLQFKYFLPPKIAKKNIKYEAEFACQEELKRIMKEATSYGC